MIFGDIQSEKVWLKTAQGEKLAEITFKEFKNLLLWRPDGAKMICIEPWQNLPDKVGQEFVEFSKKKGIDKVLPKQTKTAVRMIKYY